VNRVKRGMCVTGIVASGWLLFTVYQNLRTGSGCSAVLCALRRDGLLSIHSHSFCCWSETNAVPLKT